MPLNDDRENARMDILALAKAHNLDVIIWPKGELLTNGETISSVVSNASPEDLQRLATASSYSGCLISSLVLARLNDLQQQFSILNACMAKNFVTVRPSEN